MFILACDRAPKRSFISDGLKDLLSDLPSNVTDNIMDRLPRQEAARLCILSKKWKLVWMSYPNLKLDDQFFRDKLSNKQFWCYEFNRILTSVLISHNGPIPKFFLTIPRMDHPFIQGVSCLCSSNMSYKFGPEISLLITHLLRNGIRELTLCNHRSSRLQLPSQLFSCIQLEQLTLFKFEVNIPPTFETFKSITKLEFLGVSLIGRILESCISSCPSLETLVFRNTIYEGSLAINAPNLKLIKVEGTFESICLEGCMALVHVSIGYKATVLGKHHEKARELVEFLSRARKLLVLKLRYDSLKFLEAAGFMAMCSNTFDHLRKLELSLMPIWDTKSSVASSTRVFQNCPNLEELKISFTLSTTAKDAEDETTWKGNPRNAYQRLRTVSILQPVLQRSKLLQHLELKFIKFLLSHAPVLEKLYIPFCVNRKPELAMRLTTSLLQFRRASNKAQILWFHQLS